MCKSQAWQINADIFKCLIFTQRLTAETDAEKITTLAEMKQNQTVTLQVPEKCERIVNLRHNAKKIECRDCFEVKQVWNKQNRYQICTKIHYKTGQQLGKRPIFCMCKFKPEEKPSI